MVFDDWTGCFLIFPLKPTKSIQFGWTAFLAIQQYHIICANANQNQMPHQGDDDWLRVFCGYKSSIAAVTERGWS